MRRKIALGWAGLHIAVGVMGIAIAPFIGADKGVARGVFDALVALGVLAIGIGHWRDAA